jgi:hypothetical protein
MSNLPEFRSVELCAGDNVLALDDLWLRCFALGTMNTPAQLGGFLRGELRPSRHEYNLVAVAINEYLSDIGAPQSVPYIEQLELPDHPALPPIASLDRSRSPSDQATRADRAARACTDPEARTGRPPERARQMAGSITRVAPLFRRARRRMRRTHQASHPA